MEEVFVMIFFSENIQICCVFFCIIFQKFIAYLILSKNKFLIVLICLLWHIFTLVLKVLINLMFSQLVQYHITINIIYSIYSEAHTKIADISFSQVRACLHKRSKVYDSAFADRLALSANILRRRNLAP